MGISSYSLVTKCSNDLQVIKETALALMKQINIVSYILN